MSRKFTVPLGSDARERPLPSEVSATLRSGVRPAAEEKLYFPVWTLRGMERKHRDPPKYKQKTNNNNTGTEAVGAMAGFYGDNGWKRLRAS